MTVPRGAHLVALLVVAAAAGLFGRVYYTPDEPREASLIASLLEPGSKALPQLAGRPFAEKPPLLYWLGAATQAGLGATPAAARLPNLLYVLLTGLASAALARRAAGPAAGFAAGVVAVTALQLYQALIWLATDAPLTAGVALALLGAYRALVAEVDGERWRGYLLLHAGLAIAFFAKGFAGWLVPLSAYGTVVIAERRWRELARRELWLGFALLGLAIGGWVAWVAGTPAGRESLKVLFWYNLVGRVAALGVAPGVDYASGHHNWPGKYLLELPLYLLPWSVLALAAVRRAFWHARQRGAQGTAWRLALGAIVPPTLLLSLAATARGVYYAPPALGFAILVGLYVGGAGTALDRYDRVCWRLTQVLIAALALLLGLAAAAVSWAPAWRDATTLALGAAGLAGALLAAGLALAPGVAAAGRLPRLATATALTLSLVAVPLLYSLNAWLSLERLAAPLARETAGRPLVLLAPDETTLALASLYLPRGAVVASAGPGVDFAPALAAAGATARVLWLVPGAARWNLNDWATFLGYSASARPAAVPHPPAGLALECMLTRPGGRAYALLVPAAAGTAPAGGPRRCG